MQITRRGADRNHGWTSAILANPRFRPGVGGVGVFVESSYVRDFTTESRHDYRVWVELDELAAMIAALGDELNSEAYAAPYSRVFLPAMLDLGPVAERWAASYVGVTPDEGNDIQFSGTDADGGRVHVVVTRRDRVYLERQPERLVVIKLRKRGGPEVVYDGLGAPVWAASGKPRLGRRTISLAKIRQLN